MTGVSPWKPMGAHEDAGEAEKNPLELEVPSDVMLLLRAGERDPQVAFRCSSFESGEIADFRKKKERNRHTKATEIMKHLVNR